MIKVDFKGVAWGTLDQFIKRKMDTPNQDLSRKELRR